MVENVVPLTRSRIDANLVEVFEKLLEEARSGAIIGAAYVVERPVNEGDMWGYCGFIDRGTVGRLVCVTNTIDADLTEAGA